MEQLPLLNKIEINFIDIKPVRINKGNLFAWIKNVVSRENKNINYISFSICSDEYLLKINQEALNHDYYTDIITFELNEKGEPIEGDIYISLDRVKENAKINHINYKAELNRVIIHGVLHLCDYKDKSKKEQLEMREKENYYLNLLVKK